MSDKELLKYNGKSHMLDGVGEWVRTEVRASVRGLLT